MMLTTDQAAWARNSLAHEAKEMKKRATAMRKRGVGLLPLKPATEYVAAAFERAAIELEKSRKQINSGATA